MTESTAKGRKAKPAKPRKDFPLYAHAVGKWAKTIRGKTYYFGVWEDPQGALQEYLGVRDDLFVGRTPRSGRGLTIADLCNSFLVHCRRKVDAGEMVERTFKEYHRTCDRVVRVFGKLQPVEALCPDDFAHLRADIAERSGPLALTTEITRVRTMFNFGRKQGLITADVMFGLSFDRPSKSVLRRARAKNGKRMFSAGECRRLIQEAHTPELRAMILLALNCGFGNSDCAQLPVHAVDLDAGWIDYPRPKTGIGRRCPLWPETAEALRVVLGRRNKERELVFTTRLGNNYDRCSTVITKQFCKVMDPLGLHRPGLGFYSLRHVFRTVADSTRDFPAIRLIMGHADDSIDAAYREMIDDDRLLVVVDHVRTWLFEGG